MKKRLLPIILLLLAAAGSLRAAEDVMEIATAQDLYDFAQIIQDGVATQNARNDRPEFPQFSIADELAGQARE